MIQIREQREKKQFEKEQLAQSCVLKLLAIFEASNNDPDSDSDLVVQEVRVSLDENSKSFVCSVSFSKDDQNFPLWKNSKQLDRFPNVKGSVVAFESLDPQKISFDLMRHFFIGLPHFTVSPHSDEELKIQLTVTEEE